MTKIPLPRGKFNQLCDAKHGYVIYNKNDNVIGKCIEHYGEYCEEEIELFQQFVKPGDLVIEAGANIGTHTLPLSRMVGDTGKIYSFEAQRVLFQMLCGNLALNSITNVHAFNHAVGAEDGLITIPNIPYPHAVNMGAYSLRDFAGHEKVPLVRLDSFLGYREEINVAFIMADIEKMEFELLQGAQRIIAHAQPVLYLESDPGNEENKNVIELLHRMEYKVFRHVVNTYRPNNYNDFTDMVLEVNSAAKNLLALPKDKDITLTGDLHEIMAGEIG